MKRSLCDWIFENMEDTLSSVLTKIRLSTSFCGLIVCVAVSMVPETDTKRSEIPFPLPSVQLFVFAALFNFASDIDTFVFGDLVLVRPEVLRSRYKFIDFLYGCFVTAMAIGYGDVVPQGFLEQVVVFMVLCVCVMLAQKLGVFGNLLEKRTEFSENRYGDGLRPHVLVCGHLAPENVKTLLRELFHPDHSRCTSFRLVYLCVRVCLCGYLSLQTNKTLLREHLHLKRAGVFVL